MERAVEANRMKGIVSPVEDAWRNAYRATPLSPDGIAIGAPGGVVRPRTIAEYQKLWDQLAESGPLKPLMGPSWKVEKVVSQVETVAAFPLTVLVEGETGTGKELVVRAIHHLSRRREAPLNALDCGAIPETLLESELFGYERGAFTGAHQRKEGHFQLAAGGTLFLDEIVNLPLTTQAKLLRALQEREVQPLGGRRPVPVDVRIIAASNVPLERETRSGRFRHDLYFRLNEFCICLPPLRDRAEDILYLAHRFLVEASVEFRRPASGISEGAAQLLLRHAWPGNVRELRSVVRRALLLSPDVIRPEHLSAISGEPAAIAQTVGAGRYRLHDWKQRTLKGLEKQFLANALEDHARNVSRTAKALGVHRSTLQRLIRKYTLPAT